MKPKKVDKKKRNNKIMKKDEEEEDVGFNKQMIGDSSGQLFLTVMVFFAWPSFHAAVLFDLLADVGPIT